MATQSWSDSDYGSQRFVSPPHVRIERIQEEIERMQEEIERELKVISEVLTQHVQLQRFQRLDDGTKRNQREYELLEQTLYQLQRRFEKLQESKRTFQREFKRELQELERKLKEPEHKWLWNRSLQKLEQKLVGKVQDLNCQLKEIELRRQEILLRIAYFSSLLVCQLVLYAVHVEDAHQGGIRNLILDGWWLEFWEIILLAAGDVESNPGPRQIVDEQLAEVSDTPIGK